MLSYLALLALTWISTLTKPTGNPLQFPARLGIESDDIDQIQNASEQCEDTSVPAEQFYLEDGDFNLEDYWPTHLDESSSSFWSLQDERMSIEPGVASQPCRHPARPLVPASMAGEIPWYEAQNSNQFSVDNQAMVAGHQVASKLLQENDCAIESNLPVHDADQAIAKKFPKPTKAKRPFPRGFETLGWQTGIPEADLENMYQIISSHWPADLDFDTLKKWSSRSSRWLQKHPDIVHGMLKGDKSSWKLAIAWCKADAMYRRSASHSRPNQNPTKQKQHMCNLGWLAGKLPVDEKIKIFSRLSNHWNGASRDAVQSKLIRYAKLYGKIQSPEPLLGDDWDAFTKAADIIRKGTSRLPIKRHPEAGANDILHRYSPQYSLLSPEGKFVQIPYEIVQVKPSAKRYNTPQKWIQESSTADIDTVHHAIAAHWTDERYLSIQGDYLLKVNEYLQKNHESLHKILEGDDFEAWKVARIIAQRSQHMKSPLVYRPASSCDPQKHIELAP